jgi:beta-lactamase class D
MQKDSRKVFFVQYVEEMNNKDFSTGKHARDMVKQKLAGLIQKELH